MRQSQSNKFKREKPIASNALIRKKIGLKTNCLMQARTTAATKTLSKKKINFNSRN